MIVIKVKFKEKTIDIKNESNSKKEFLANWNGYTIEILPYETHLSSNGSSMIMLKIEIENGIN